MAAPLQPDATPVLQPFNRLSSMPKGDAFGHAGAPIVRRKPTS